jgi:acetyltransferase
MALPQDLHDAIGELVPPRWSRNNPIDLAGGETRDTIPAVLDLIASHPDVDALVYLGLGIQGNTARAYRESPYMPNEGMERIASFHERQEVRYAKAAVEISLREHKPIIVASELAIGDPDNPGIATLNELGWPCFASPGAGITALDALWAYARDR